jgi:hypothetical protein
VSKARTRRKRDEELDAAVRGAPASPVLQLQQLAGNRAVTSLMRQPTKTQVKPAAKQEPKPPQMSDKEASDDLAFALKYVDDFYEGVRDVLELKDKVRENAIRAFVDFGKLKDPPSIADAVLLSLAESALGLIPGGNIIKMGLTAGIFALDMRALKKDLDVMPIVGMSAEDEKKKGPQTAHKEKATKYYDRGKTVVDAGAGAVKAAKEAKEKAEAAAAEEATAKELAGLHSGRVTDWTKAIADSRVQENKVTEWLRKAAAGGRRGGLEAAVKKDLGPIPEVSQKFQDEFGKAYELELYRAKYAGAKWVTTETDYYSATGSADQTLTSSRLEGGSLSKATMRRIAEVAGQPHMAPYEEYIVTQILKVKKEFKKDMQYVETSWDKM